MEKEFVPYEIALALKELRFNESCFKYYVDNKLIYNGLGISNKDCDWVDNQCSAPFYQQAFRWFREKYKLFGYVMDTEDGNYYWGISKSFSGETEEDSSEGPYDDTYEEAELECLKKLIEIVKKKQ